MQKYKVTLNFGEYECEVEAGDEQDAKTQALASHYTSLRGRITGWWMGLSQNAKVEEIKADPNIIS